MHYVLVIGSGARELAIIKKLHEDSNKERETIFIICIKTQDNCEYILSNCLNIPLLDNSIDYIMSIAVIHHLSTPNRRLASLMEIYRVLKIGGKSLIYAWAKEQPKFKNESSQDVFVKWNLQKKYSNLNQDETFYRYYHLFKKNELELLINKINGIKIIESGSQSNNWYCIIQKYK